MRILVVDEDRRDVPHICEGLAQLDCEVKQAHNLEELKKMMSMSSFDGIILDLMMPTFGVPAEECEGGFTTGAYIYEHDMHPLLKNVPFIVLTGASLAPHFMKKAIRRLESYREFRGVMTKTCSEEEIIKQLKVGEEC